MVGGVLQLALQMPALRRLGLLPRIGLSWSSACAPPGPTRACARSIG
jgi:putative peptidoglycan lipid II flippase